MQVEQITEADIEAVTDPEVIALADQIVLNNHGNGNASVLIDRFAARHRHQARAEVVGEIVAWLQDGFMRDFDQLWRDQLINEIEAKFGGRDER